MGKVVDFVPPSGKMNRDRRNAISREKWSEKYAVKVEAGFRSVCDVCGSAFIAPRAKVRVCGAGGCKEQLKRERLAPFTVAHFKKWAKGIVLDTDRPWRVEPFQERFLEDVFAGVPCVWLLIAEGNTKTTTLAGLALYHIQFQPGGRVPVAASSRDQAFEMYLQAQGMVERSNLHSVFTCHEGLRQIKCESQGSRVQVYSADDRTGDGVIFTLALIDELHRHRDLRLYRTWRGKLAKRGGQAVVISTAGEPGSEFEEARDTIRQTADERTTRPGFLRAVAGATVLQEYALPEGGDVENLDEVLLANPFSGVTKKALAEKRSDPAWTLEHWSRMTCNVATRTSSAAVTEAEWLGAIGKSRIPAGEPVYCGLDVAWKYDTTALIPLWVPSLERRVVGQPTILEPPRTGDMLDPDMIEDALLKQHELNPVQVLVMDTTKAEQLAVWAHRMLGCVVIDRSQSVSHGAQDYERFLEALRLGWLEHPDDKDLNTHVLNAVVKPLPGDRAMFYRPSKSRGGTHGEARRKYIDGLVALAMVNSYVTAESQVEEPKEMEIMVAMA